MRDNRKARQWLCAGYAALLIGLGVISAWRAIEGRFDFHHFYIDARYVWEHGALNPEVAQPATEETRNLPFYLPVVPLVLSPLTALGRWPAALAWSVAQMAALAYSVTVLARWVAAKRQAGADDSPPQPVTNKEESVSVALIVAVLLALYPLYEAARFNQISYFVLAFILGGASALDRGRPRTAGLIFGVATVVKLLPGIFVLWLLLKRRWSAAMVSAGTVVILTLVPPLLAFGPARTLAYHREWFDYNVRGDAGGGMLRTDLPDHFIDRRNQSITQVLARWTWPEHPFRLGWQPVQFTAETCKRMGDGITGVLLLALLFCTRRSWRQISLDRRHAEIAAYAIAMFALSPLVRQYYLVWALPGVVMLAGWALGHGESVGSWRRIVGRMGLVVWIVGMALCACPPARVAGAHLLMLLVLGALLLLGEARSRNSVASITPAPT